MEKKVLKATEAEAELIYREYEQRKLNYEEKLKERMEAGKIELGEMETIKLGLQI